MKPRDQWRLVWREFRRVISTDAISERLTAWAERNEAARAERYGITGNPGVGTEPGRYDED